MQDTRRVVAVRIGDIFAGVCPQLWKCDFCPRSVPQQVPDVEVEQDNVPLLILQDSKKQSKAFSAEQSFALGMSQSGQSIDALVDDAIRAAEQLDLGQTGQVQQYGQPGESADR